MNIDFDEFIREVVSEFKPTGDYIYDKQVLNALYETKFGICNHYTDQGVLSSARINPSERFLDGFLYEGHLRTFIYNDINKKIGMTFDDYLNRPRYEIDLINRVVQSTDDIKNKTNETMLAKLGQDNKAGKT